MEGVKQFKDITIHYSATASATLTIDTDMPGDAMALRRTLTLASTTGARKTDTIPLEQSDALLEGKLIKFKIVSTGTVILYEGFIRFRRVGEYIDGAGTEIWETQPIFF